MERIISEGVYKRHELLPRFLAHLKEHEPNEYKWLVARPEFAKIIEREDWYSQHGNESDGVRYGEYGDLLHEAVDEAMHSTAEDGYMFGSHPEDCQRWGYWKKELFGW